MNIEKEMKSRDFEREPVLEVHNLKSYYASVNGAIPAVDGVDLTLYPGEIVGIVGESGCGKSTVVRALMGLMDPVTSHREAGTALFEGRDLFSLSEKELCKVRGKGISMIFQNPLSALDPVYTIGNQITEILKIHESITDKQAREKAVELLRQVNIPSPELRMNQYPHELSGGMQQRVVIAIALACNPKILIADEPTTALDVTIQAQIFELMEKLKREHDTAIMLITHDMGVVSELADDVAVMYMGSIVERGSVREVLKYPAHPYTAALLRSIPILHKGRGQRLEPIRGSTPDPYDRPKGCQFAPRCDFCCEKCRQEMPSEVPVCDGHAVRCWNAEQVYAGHREEVEAV